MTLLTGAGASYTVASAVLARIVSDLAAAGVWDARNGRSGVVPGAIAWDGCEQCGLLVVSLARTYYTDDFPTQSTAPQSSCQGAFLASEFTVQLIRCAPTVDAQGKGPSVTALDTSAQQIMGDAWLVLTATCCKLAELVLADQIVEYIVNQMVPVGPEGACVGTQVNFTVAMQR
jgi:hypothetical protein